MTNPTDGLDWSGTVNVISGANALTLQNRDGVKITCKEWKPKFKDCSIQDSKTLDDLAISLADQYQSFDDDRKQMYEENEHLLRELARQQSRADMWRGNYEDLRKKYLAALKQIGTLLGIPAAIRQSGCPPKYWEVVNPDGTFSCYTFPVGEPKEKR